MTKTEVFELLKQSIAAYSDILETMTTLESLLSKGEPKAVSDYLLQLDLQQEEVMRVDGLLKAALETISPTQELKNLLGERQNLIDLLMSRNAELRRNLEGRLSVMSEDVARMRHGKKAVKGYRHRVDHRGSVMNSQH